VGSLIGLYPAYTKQFRITGRYQQQVTTNRLCNRNRITVTTATSNASIRERRIGDIGMLKRGVLAWKLYGKGLVVCDVVILRSCVGLGDYVGVRV
jgi:hypothetical protein